MMSSVIFGLGVAATLCACAFCLIKGNAAERAGAALILAFDIIGDIIFYAYRPYFPMTLVFACDFALAFGLLIVAVRYGSLWLGCAMLLQGVIICSEGLSFSGDGLSKQAQGVLNNDLSMAMLACVVFSAALSWRKRVRTRRAPPLAKTSSTSFAA